MPRPMLLSSFLTLLLVGCGGDSPAAGTESGKRERKDRGEAAMTIGGQAWQARNAKARLANGSMILTSSRTERTDDGRFTRQELRLQLPDWQGVGEYRAQATSMLLGVGLDVAAAEAGDAAVQKAATEALTGASTMPLHGAVVTITAATDSEVTGTFAWHPPAGLERPAIENGTFRALVAD